MVGDSYFKRIKENYFTNELRQGKAFFRSFSGANAKQLRHYNIPILVDGKPDANVIQVVTNDILNHANHENIAHSIINIGLGCKNNGFNEVLISSILVKRILILLQSCVESMTCYEIYVRQMVLVLFAMVLLQLIIYGKMMFSCRTWERIY